MPPADKDRGRGACGARPGAGRGRVAAPDFHSAREAFPTLDQEAEPPHRSPKDPHPDRFHWEPFQDSLLKGAILRRSTQKEGPRGSQEKCGQACSLAEKLLIPRRLRRKRGRARGKGDPRSPSRRAISGLQRAEKEDSPPPPPSPPPTVRAPRAEGTPREALPPRPQVPWMPVWWDMAQAAVREREALPALPPGCAAGDSHDAEPPLSAPSGRQLSRDPPPSAALTLSRGVGPGQQVYSGVSPMAFRGDDSQESVPKST